MGWFDGFPFKSKAQMQEEQQAFEARVFPFGLEQREAAAKVLRQVLADRRLNETQILFAFISAKDTFTKSGNSASGLQDARRYLASNVKWVKGGDADVILALVRLDAAAESLAAYPTAQQVLQAARENA